MKRIVVGIDGSTGGQDAVLWSAQLAAATAAELVAVTAFQPKRSERGSALDDRRHVEEATLDELVAPAREIGPVRTCVADGDPRTVLLGTAEAEDADLIVVGAVGSDSSPGFLHFGSVAEYLVHHSSRPIVLVRPGTTVPVRRIVLGVDGSERNRRAVEWTADLAAALGATVTAVAVEEPVFEWSLSSSVDNWRRSYEDQIRADWAAPVREAGADLEARAVRDLSPTEGLLRVADDEDADLLVVGARGLGGVTGLRAGGVAVKVVHHARRTVAVVPAEPSSVY